MHTRHRIAGLLLSTLMLCSGIATAAQTPAKAITPLRGTIDQVSDTALQISNRQGEKVDVKLNDKTQVFSVAKGSIDDIKPEALEVHVFAASLRGTGEGHSPWESADGKINTMTNGTIGKLVNANGRTLTVKYGDRQKNVIVPDDTPVVTINPGDRGLLKPGTHIVLFSATNDKGERVATRISAGKDGTVPPM